ncbi:MAG: DUF4124 domain-containing protein [Deltaproteobacteria bacterium]|nr:DUF4124 domain-containing protein [Deltaproteobacteria bacterium]
MRLESRAVFCALMIGAAMLAAAAPSHLAAKDYYEWVDDQGVNHFTDEFSKVPPQYRGRTTVRGARVLRSGTGEPDTAEAGQEAGTERVASPGKRAVILSTVESSFELPRAFSSDRGVWKEEEFRELGQGTGPGGEFFFSSADAKVQIRTWPGQKPKSRLSALVTALQLAQDYGKEHPPEKLRREDAMGPVIIPSGHVVVMFLVRGSSDDKAPAAYVQYIMGPSGTAMLRWTGDYFYYDPISQEVLVGWQSLSGPVRMEAFSVSDLEHPWIMGAVVGLAVLLAASVVLGFLLVRRIRGY